MNYKLEKITQNLCNVAIGTEKADTVIKNVNIINVITEEIVKNQDIAIVKGRIAYVGENYNFPSQNIIDGSGLFASPGFMDGHLHIESSMMTVENYSNAVMPHGTTAIFQDPHEIANVLGEVGIQYMIDSGKNVPIRNFVTMPSCVPALEGISHNFKTLDSKVVKRFIEQSEICGLGEMMNFPGVIYSDLETHKKLQYTLKNNKVITGHFTMENSEKELNAYISSGVTSCHETVKKEEALKKLRLGMYVQIRQGSAWQDLEEVIKVITENKISSRYINLVSDDIHADTILEKGHMDYILNMAIEKGVPPIEAIKMVTLNVANCFKISDDYGSITPSKYADIVLFENINNIKPQLVLINGELVAKNGELINKPKEVISPDYVKNTVKILNNIVKEDLKVTYETTENSVKTKVIEIVPYKATTYKKEINLPVIKNEVQIDLQEDVIKIAVFERHNFTGAKSVGFVKGFNIKSGAVATTVGHDSHNLCVIGVNEDDMVIACNTLRENGGGIVIVNNGVVKAFLPLNIAGLMSDQKAEVVSKNLKELEAELKNIGCNVGSAFMTLALVTLPVIPSIRITTKGLVDVNKFELVDLFN